MRPKTPQEPSLESLFDDEEIKEDALESISDGIDEETEENSEQTQDEGLQYEPTESGSFDWGPAPSINETPQTRPSFTPPQAKAPTKPAISTTSKWAAPTQSAPVKKTADTQENSTQSNNRGTHNSPTSNNAPQDTEKPENNATSSTSDASKPPSGSKFSAASNAVKNPKAAMAGGAASAKSKAIGAVKSKLPKAPTPKLPSPKNPAAAKAAKVGKKATKAALTATGLRLPVALIKYGIPLLLATTLFITLLVFIPSTESSGSVDSRLGNAGSTALYNSELVPSNALNAYQNGAAAMFDERYGVIPWTIPAAIAAAATDHARFSPFDECDRRPGTASAFTGVISIPSSSPAGCTTEDLSTWPAPNPAIGNSSTSAIGPYLLRPEVLLGLSADEQQTLQALTPLNLAASSTDVILQELDRIRRDMIDNLGWETPQWNSSSEEDANYAKEFWTEAVSRLGIANPHTPECDPIPLLPGVPATASSIHETFKCVILTTSDLSTLALNPVTGEMEEVELPQVKAEFIVNEALSIASAASAYGQANSDQALCGRIDLPTQPDGRIPLIAGREPTIEEKELAEKGQLVLPIAVSNETPVGVFGLTAETFDAHNVVTGASRCDIAANIYAAAAAFVADPLTARTEGPETLLGGWASFDHPEVSSIVTTSRLTPKAEQNRFSTPAGYHTEIVELAVAFGGLISVDPSFNQEANPFSSIPSGKSVTSFASTGASFAFNTDLGQIAEFTCGGLYKPNSRNKAVEQLVITWDQMCRDAQSEGIDLYFTDSFRSQAEQQGCWDSKGADAANLCAPVGSSPHEKGKAIDICQSSWQGDDCIAGYNWANEIVACQTILGDIRKFSTPVPDSAYAAAMKAGQDEAEGQEVCDSFGEAPMRRLETYGMVNLCTTMGRLAAWKQAGWPSASDRPDLFGPNNYQVIACNGTFPGSTFHQERWHLQIDETQFIEVQSDPSKFQDLGTKITWEPVNTTQVDAVLLKASETTGWVAASLLSTQLTASDTPYRSEPTGWGFRCSDSNPDSGYITLAPEPQGLDLGCDYPAIALHDLAIAASNGGCHDDDHCEEGWFKTHLGQGLTDLIRQGDTNNVWEDLIALYSHPDLLDHMGWNPWDVSKHLAADIAAISAAEATGHITNGLLDMPVSPEFQTEAVTHIDAVQKLASALRPYLTVADESWIFSGGRISTFGGMIYELPELDVASEGVAGVNKFVNQLGYPFLAQAMHASDISFVEELKTSSGQVYCGAAYPSDLRLVMAYGGGCANNVDESLIHELAHIASFINLASNSMFNQYSQTSSLKSELDDFVDEAFTPSVMARYGWNESNHASKIKEEIYAELIESMITGQAGSGVSYYGAASGVVSTHNETHGHTYGIVDYMKKIGCEAGISHSGVGLDIDEGEIRTIPGSCSF